MNKENLIEIGNCTDEQLIEEIFGSVSEFARLTEELGEEFEYGKFMVKYNDEKDIHTFFKKS